MPSATICAWPKSVWKRPGAPQEGSRSRGAVCTDIPLWHLSSAKVTSSDRSSFFLQGIGQFRMTGVVNSRCWVKSGSKRWHESVSSLWHWSRVCVRVKLSQFLPVFAQPTSPTSLSLRSAKVCNTPSSRPLLPLLHRVISPLTYCLA